MFCEIHKHSDVLSAVNVVTVLMALVEVAILIDGAVIIGDRHVDQLGVGQDSLAGINSVFLFVQFGQTY